jgi:hypothetical protein
MKSFGAFSVIFILMACFFIGCLGSDDEEIPIIQDDTNNGDNSGNTGNTGGNTKGLKGIDIAISTEAYWMEQDTADREMSILASQINGKVKSVQIFAPAMQNQLATWMTSRINDNKIDVLVLCGVTPNSIYKAGNEQPDGSIAEKFLDGGNMIVNTGDYMFFIGTGLELNNGEDGLQNISDVKEFIFWVGGFMTPTDEGTKYLPSLTEFSSDRSFNLDVPVNPWVPEVVFAQVDQGGMQADPAVIRNTTTNGRIAIFYQSEWQEDLPRGQVISEFILNWLPTVLPKP